MLWLYLVIFVASCFVLAKAGSLTVRALTKVAGVLRWSEFAVAFLLMAFTTTLPELFVGITSALYKRPQLSFGNIIGSNVVHFTFVAALGVFISGKLKAKSAIVQQTSLYTALIVALPIFLMMDKTLSRQDGVILLSAVVLYFSRLLYHKERFAKTVSHKAEQGFGFGLLFKSLAVFLVGVALLLLSAEGIVWASLNFAGAVGWPLVILGMLLLGLGTNLPEISFTVKAARSGHKDMILGDLMGAVAVNSGFVLGMCAVLCPIEITNFTPYLSGIIFTLLTIMLFILFTRSGKEITRKEGAILFFVYFAFVFWQLFV